MRFLLPLLVLSALIFTSSVNSAQEHLSEILSAPENPAVTEKKPVPLPLQAEKFRKEFSFKIRRGTAIRKDYDHCKNGLDQLEVSEHKLPFYLLLALYHRTIDREPIKALEILAPLVIPAEDAEKWITEQRNFAQQEFEKWSKEFDVAKQSNKPKKDLPKRPDGLFVEFPAMETWKLDDSTAAVALEIARCLIVLNRHEEALKIINTVGENCDKEYKILAAECAADLMTWTKMYDKAVEFYRLSLHYFRAIRENGDEFVVLLPDEQQIIKNRINYKLGAIRDLAEQGRFTPDWLAYRNAQRKHFEEESLFEAYWMYKNIVTNYPKTLCAEASECYLIKILTLFSNPAVIKEAAKRYDIILDQLEDAKAQWRQAKRTGMAMPFITGLEAYIEWLKFVVNMFEKTPFGRKALEEAEKRTEIFVEKNKYGLYRGEVLLDVGAAYLVSNFDIENGEKWLTRAADWFDNVQNFDKDLKDFELPDSVRKISQPPKDERFKDRWNNVKMAKPKPGDFFNRRTCAWYWSSKRKDVTLLQGLVAFAKEDYGAAEKHWNLLAELDKEFYAQQTAAGWGNATTLARLTWNLRNQKGSLYATPEEMASFKDKKRRIAILLADLLYESEYHQAALSIYQRLENRELGTLSKNELAYVMFATFACLCWIQNIDEIVYLSHKAKLFENTPSEARAYFYFGNRANSANGIKYAIQSYEICVKKFPKTKEANLSRLFLAEYYKDLGNYWQSLNNLNEAKQCYIQAHDYYRECQKQDFDETTIKQIQNIADQLQIQKPAK